MLEEMRTSLALPCKKTYLAMVLQQSSGACTGIAYAAEGLEGALVAEGDLAALHHKRQARVAGNGVSTSCLVVPIEPLGSRRGNIYIELASLLTRLFC